MYSFDLDYYQLFFQLFLSYFRFINWLRQLTHMNDYSYLQRATSAKGNTRLATTGATQARPMEQSPG